ncbi:MAG: tRNA (adenosine(37)-N6)-threonylcarbamoyltransferase complex dimerization subunit type 1 TsaB [Pyrinomonadaceae bacterium]
MKSYPVLSVHNQPLILSVETATLGGSVCVTRGDYVLAALTGDLHISHSNRLLLEVAECLERADVFLSDVDLFAAASGPGSFTGLRIGIATVNALAATLGRPCVGIPTLRAVGRAAGPSSATIALLPAGRGEMFAQLFSVSPDGSVTEIDAPAHLSLLGVIDRYGAIPNLRWAGAGAQIQRDLLRDHAQEKGIEFGAEGIAPTEELRQCWTLAPEILNLGEHVAALSFEQWKRGEVVTPPYLTALYVRPSDAELKCQ